MLVVLAGQATFLMLAQSVSALDHCVHSLCVCFNCGFCLCRWLFFMPVSVLCFVYLLGVTVVHSSHYVPWHIHTTWDILSPRLDAKMILRQNKKILHLNTNPKTKKSSLFNGLIDTRIRLQFHLHFRTKQFFFSIIHFIKELKKSSLSHICVFALMLYIYFLYMYYNISY